MIWRALDALILLLFITNMICVAGYSTNTVGDDTKTMTMTSIARNNESGRGFDKSVVNEHSESFVGDNSYNNQVLSPSLIRQEVTYYNVPTSEVYALKSMYDALDGTDWYWRSNSSRNGYKWEFDDAITTINPCADSWQGITCNCTLLNGTCHITEIDLSAYGLDGYLSDMTNLTMMVRLTLSNNIQLKGDLSPLSNMIALEYLDLDDTFITGDLSPLSNMTALEYLGLSNTTITGDLSPLSNMTTLMTLGLSNNAITGDLSPLSNMTAL